MFAIYEGNVIWTGGAWWFLEVRVAIRR